MSSRITIADVAREAGVSSMTVSRAINNKGDVSPATRQRVLEVVEHLGYRPSGIARGLATKRTGTLGLVVPDVANPFFSEVARGAEHLAYGAGYNVFLCNTEEDPERELAVLGSLEEKCVDGVVVCSSRLEDAELLAAIAHFSSVVLVNRRLESDGVGTVLLDDRAGGQMATQHLLQTGRQALAFLAGPQTSRSGRQRAMGYRDALAAFSLEHNPAWIIPCSPTVAGGHETVHALLSLYPELTGLFCFNDLVAVGALQACSELGRSVPEEVAVVGFDDIPLAALVTPPLTTGHVNRYELGAQAVRLLLDQIDGCPDGCAEVVLKPELVIRASAPKVQLEE